MCSDEVAVRVDGVSKVFPIYDKPHHRLMQMLSRRNKQRWFREFTAVKNVDFTVRRGETVGIVGRNGSGKSTLLQLICGTLSPTSGSIEVNGRIAALLELGAGFNPEFTGRENVYLYGTVLGLTREEISSRFDEIAAFADIGDFIEQPVKNYSSGMYVRLAFAVAINVTPSLLIVDEALSVGDEAFQRKCYARINAIRDSGATVLFVSHSAGTVIDLCDRAVLLDHGEMLCEGTPKFVVSHYHRLLYAPVDRVNAIRESIRNNTPQSGSSEAATPRLGPMPEQPARSEPHGAEDESYFEEGLVPKSTLPYPSRGALIVEPQIHTLTGRRVNVLCSGSEYVYVYRVRFDRAAYNVRFGMLIKSLTGVEIGGAVSATVDQALPAVEEGGEVTVRFRFQCLLAPAVYFMNAGVLATLEEGEEYLHRIIDVAMFRVMPAPSRLATGMVDFHVMHELEEHRTQSLS